MQGLVSYRCSERFNRYTATELWLEPGRYVLLCFVPDEETGQPHALLGMVEEFTVE